MSNWVPGTRCDSSSSYVPSSYALTQPPAALFFNDHNCLEGGGGSFALRPGERVPDLHQYMGGKNDLISSIVVPPNVVVQVWRDGNYTGATTVLSAGVYPHLGNVRYNAPNENEHLDDNISSIQVRPVEEHREFLRKCCFGQTTGVCANFTNPYGADCQGLLGIPGDCNSREAFFNNTNCRRWIQGLDSPLKNEFGTTYCPQAVTQGERDYCACFLARDFPPEWESSPNVAILKAQWPCLDATCNDATKSLQPYNKNCPSTLTICSQAEVRTAIESGSVKNQTVQNACGNLFLGGQTQVPTTLPPTLPPASLPGTGTLPQPPATTPPSPAGTTTPPAGTTPPSGGFLSQYTTNQKLVGAGAILTVLLLIMAAVFFSRRP